MSKYIGKRVSYTCENCGKLFTWSKDSIDDRNNGGENIYCSKVCKEQEIISCQAIELSDEQRKNLTVGVRLPSISPESV